MHRRQFLAVPSLALLAAAPAALAASGHTPYSREVYEQARASGKPFLLDFYASW